MERVRVTTTNLTPGWSGSALGVALAASAAPAVESVREIKVCELCGMNFTRSLLSRQRDCARCAAKEAARRERERVPQEMTPEEIEQDRRKLNRMDATRRRYQRARERTQ